MRKDKYISPFKKYVSKHKLKHGTWIQILNIHGADWIREGKVYQIDKLLPRIFDSNYPPSILFIESEYPMLVGGWANLGINKSFIIIPPGRKLNQLKMSK